MDEFQGLTALFRPIFHHILMIWNHTKYYDVQRVVTLIKEISNDLIMQVRLKKPNFSSRVWSQAGKFLPGEELIQMDPQEAVEKLKTVISLIEYFKGVYGDYKVKSEEWCSTRRWKFRDEVLFARLDVFQQRCEKMLDLQLTCLQVKTFFLYAKPTSL